MNEPILFYFRWSNTFKILIHFVAVLSQRVSSAGVWVTWVSVPSENTIWVTVSSRCLQMPTEIQRIQIKCSGHVSWMMWNRVRVTTYQSFVHCYHSSVLKQIIWDQIPLYQGLKAAMWLQVMWLQISIFDVDLWLRHAEKPASSQWDQRHVKINLKGCRSNRSTCVDAGLTNGWTNGTLRNMYGYSCLNRRLLGEESGSSSPFSI